MAAAKEFQAAGGTSIAHVRLPSYPTNVVEFVATCEQHVAFSQRIRDETDLTVYTAIGPYPLEPMKVAEAVGWDKALEYGKACFDACRPFFARQEAHCMGEIGRAHFDVPADVQAKNNELLQYGLQVAAECGVPAMLHTEHTTADTMAEFAAMADAAGLPRERVIKHYCGPLVADGEHHGLIPSVIAGRSNIRKAIAKDPSGRWMLETDYIDSAERPNVVMPCDTVPKRVLGLMENGEISEPLAHSIGQVQPERLYL